MKDKILVVDDMEMNREILRGIFEDDYEVILAENGREAVEYINLNRGKLARFFLVLSMPGNGWVQESLIICMSRSL